MPLRVTQFGEPVLRQTGEIITRFDADLQQLARDMIETMYAADGIGLAAQQVGHAVQLFVMDVSHLPEEDLDYLVDGRRPPVDLIMPMALVNPRISTLPGKAVTAEEGCLSFPGIRGDVPRANAISVEYQDLNGQTHLIECSGWFARVIQHETDHLNGILFIDHMQRRQLRMLQSKLTRLEQRSIDTLKD
jgi:peptide deformylase